MIPPTALREAVELTDLSPTISATTTRVPLWDRWLFLWIIVGCLTIEWATRKLTGLS